MNLESEKFWIYAFVIIAVILLILAAFGCYFNPTPLTATGS